MLNKQYAVIVAVVLLGGLIVFSLFVGLHSSFHTCINEAAETYRAEHYEGGASSVPTVPLLHGYASCTNRVARHDEGVITAISTAFLTLVTGGLVWLGWLQLHSSRIQLRSYIFATTLNPYWEKDPVTGQYNWRFRAGWTNTGETATRHFTSCVGGQVRNTLLPAGYNFDADLTDPGTGLVAPKQTMQSGAAPISPQPAVTPQDILDAQAGKKFIYIYGRARYRDIFPNSKEHVSRFCWTIHCVGDPNIYDPHNSQTNLGFSYVNAAIGNCTDEECVAARLG